MDCADNNFPAPRQAPAKQGNSADTAGGPRWGLRRSRPSALWSRCENIAISDDG